MLHSLNSVSLRNRFNNQPTQPPTPPQTQPPQTPTATVSVLSNPTTTPTPIKNPSFSGLTLKSEKIISSLYPHDNLIGEVNKMVGNKILKIKITDTKPWKLLTLTLKNANGFLGKKITRTYLLKPEDNPFDDPNIFKKHVEILKKILKSKIK